MVEFDRFQSKIDQFYIEFDQIDSIKSLESESTSIRQSNSDSKFDSTTSIRFGTPNRISLVDKNVSYKVCQLNLYDNKLKLTLKKIW